MNTENQKSAEQMDLLTAVENIDNLAAKSVLNDEFFDTVAPYADYISEMIGINREQSVMLALLISHSDDGCVSTKELSDSLDCSTARLLRYTNYIDELEKLGIVMQIRPRFREIRSRNCYRIQQEIIDAFKRDEKFVPRNLSGLNCNELFDEFDTVFEMRNNDELSYDITLERIGHLLDCNKNLQFVSKLRSYELKPEDEILLIVFASLSVNRRDDNVVCRDFSFLYERGKYNQIKSALQRDAHPLLNKKLIEFANNDGFVNNEAYCLTKQTKDELLSEMNIGRRNARNRNDVIKAEDIKAKNLFFSEKVSRKVDELGDLMENSQYEQIRKRLEDEKFRCGFACLFYGAPGTGKTETALQLARRTGRDIMQVNIAKIKSMWVGESEKNLKRVFDVYREKVKECDVAPILLFNEADAIIGKRSENAERSVDKMYHTMQNILLQEMETLDGIMIATTNLAQSFDRAFERRFLYKIKFDKPTVEARMSIWHEMIPDLTDDETRTLSSKYEFSGGQIENIARRHAIGKILHGDSENLLNELLGYCDDEKIETKEKKAIGF
ncbi:MAG: AAA family ATPase [Salinivirgaceae bacterium]|nr:AAA family ATPase [Salinivirgaceae bacterium]